jgi:hypothetical protein
MQEPSWQPATAGRHKNTARTSSRSTMRLRKKMKTIDIAYVFPLQHHGGIIP